LTFLLRLPPNLDPILFQYILVYLDHARVETVSTVSLATRNPILFAGFTIKIVGFETSF
jgi:hypothetical protein